MNITALIENCITDNREDLEKEHGLSLYIDYNNLKILFDAGASDAFERNAIKLGVDLEKVDMAILSHQHYDHGGGLSRFLEINSKASVHLCRQMKGNTYFKSLGGLINKYIGLDKKIFVKHPNRFVFVNGTAEVSKNVFIITEICRKYPQPKGNSKLLVCENGNWLPDPFDHELIVVIKEEKELVILTGCAHNGILNMVETVVRQFPDMPIKAIIGGFHLAGIPVPQLLPETIEEIRAIASDLLKYPVKTVYTGHCTGMKAYGILKEVMGNKLEYLDTGKTISI
ncbi:Beta-lactamase domain protein [Desulfamplus magnetovallimortis]|uniref:Beta-lactamase domain protein n=1 Tax=Desulfamplus magnetovallimortis TaxID=1246637 RepID=A0A1W1HE94_9BACT|nr:MBL fold metallo-hydrolase [Desulfamplus magnetovallimortis]SLM30756.1 Beta-lactamase domain protein [Desulfamplus magnetovallimortis]